MNARLLAALATLRAKSIAALALVLLAFAPTAHAQYSVRDANGIIQSFGSANSGGNIYPKNVLMGVNAGVPLLPNWDSSGNIGVNIQGIVPASQSGTWNFNCSSGCSGAAAYTDGSTFTQGTTGFTVIGGTYNTSITNLTAGQAGALQLTLDRMAYINVGKVGGSAVATAASGVQKVGVVGNAGATMDAPMGASAAPTDALAVLCQYNSSLPGPSSGQTVAQQCDAKGNGRDVIMDAAGNARGANVNASNQLSVSIDASAVSNMSTNVAQFGGSAVATGTGTGGSGVPRVTVSNDSTVGLVAGSAIVGKFGIDQTTPGATNAVQDAATSATGSAVPAKAGYLGANSSGNLTGLIQADTSVAISVSTATTTQLVALSSGKKIYVTAWDVLVAGADNVTLEYGTGSNCGTGTTTLTGAYNFPTSGGISKGNGLGVVLVVPASNALCMVTSQAVQASGSVSFTQF